MPVLERRQGRRDELTRCFRKTTALPKTGDINSATYRSVRRDCSDAEEHGEYTLVFTFSNGLLAVMPLELEEPGTFGPSYLSAAREMIVNVTGVTNGRKYRPLL